MKLYEVCFVLFTMINDGVFPVNFQQAMKALKRDLEANPSMAAQYGVTFKDKGRNM